MEAYGIACTVRGILIGLALLERKERQQCTGSVQLVRVVDSTWITDHVVGGAVMMGHSSGGYHSWVSLVDFQ